MLYRQLASSMNCALPFSLFAAEYVNSKFGVLMVLEEPKDFIAPHISPAEAAKNKKEINLF